MLGTLRFNLAILVVLAHLWQKPYWFGAYAVFAFYMISGYLMTLIMNRKYGYTRSGVVRFAINRILRIYPPYLFAVLVSLTLIALAGAAQVQQFKAPMHLPTSPTEILQNLLLIGLHPTEGSRLIPPAWALGVELIFYALIAAGLGRNRPVALCWLLASIATTGWLLLSGADFPTRYFTLLAASLPFSIGAALFHYRAAISALLRPLSISAAAILYLAALGLPVIHKVLIGDFTPLLHPEGIYFYGNLLFGFVLIAKLVDARSLPLIKRQHDEQLGNLCYPIYLIHWPVAFMVSWLVLPGAAPGLPLLLVSLPAIVMAAAAINHWIEQPIERLRSTIAGEQITAPSTATTTHAVEPDRVIG